MRNLAAYIENVATPTRRPAVTGRWSENAWLQRQLEREAMMNLQLLSGKAVSFLLAVGLLASASAKADQARGGGMAEGAASSQEPKECEVSRLQPHEPSYGIFQRAENDEAALRAHYSFRYVLFPVQDSAQTARTPGSSCVIAPSFEYGMYLKYTGEFDFYAGSRDSGPVINRISNPAIHYRWKKPLDSLDSLRWLDVGVEHLSDGQTTEITSPADAARAQQAYDQDDHKFFDTVSRGVNFVSTEVRFGSSAGRFGSLYVKAKFYFHRDTDITWGPLAGTGTTISDYDLGRLLWGKRFGPGESEVSVAWTLGKRGLATDSWDLDYLLSTRSRWTWYARYHHGPLQTLSNYTQERRSIGVGLKFSP